MPPSDGSEPPDEPEIEAADTDEPRPKRWPKVLAAVVSGAVVVGGVVVAILGLDETKSDDGETDDDDSDDYYDEDEDDDDECGSDCLYELGDIYCPDCHRGD